jgi:putative addiction module component (TIGR02574 family)
MTISDLSELLKLTPAERIQLAQDLWDSIPEEEPEALALTEEEHQELDRRLAEHERDPSTALTWEDVRARLWRRFGA